MRKLLPLLLLAALPVSAQNWSVGVGTGPFFFGDLVRRTVRIGTEESEPQQSVLSAATRAGLTVDLERNLSNRLAIRLEGTFTRAPLGIKRKDVDDAVAVEAGDLDVATFALPLVFRINPQGTFRFHVHGGPAHAAYKIRRRENAPATLDDFRGTRTTWGWAAGGGVGWYFSEHFAVEGQATNISTSSPFHKDEIGGAGTVEIPRPNHLHTTVGVRYRF